MTKYIYAVCHGDDIWNEAQTLEDAVIYIYHLHIGDYQSKLEKVSGLISDINDF